MTTTDSTTVEPANMGDLSAIMRNKLTERTSIPGLDVQIPAWAAIIPFDADKDAIAERIALKAFEAETLDDMLEDTDTVPIEDLISGQLRIEGVSLQRSTVEEDQGIGVYVAVEFTNLRNGDKGVFTTSAKGVMMQLANAVARKWLPFECTIAEVDTGKNGRSNPLHLAKVNTF